MTDIKVLERVGLEALQAGQLQMARTTFEQILDIDPDHAPTLHKLGFVLLELQDAEGAAPVFSQYVAIHPENIDAQIGYGMALMLRGDVNGALKRALSAHETAPKHIPAMRLASAAAMQLSRWDVLLKLSEQWQSAVPGDPAAINNMAHAYFEMGEFERSRDSYKKLLDANPNDPRILTTYARSCLAAFDYESTISALEKAQSLTAPTAEMLYTLSRAKMFLGDLKGAEQACLQSISTDPSYALSYAHLATLRRGRVETPFVEKMHALLENVSLLPEQRASLNFALGQISENESDYSQAMSFFDSGNAIAQEILEKQGLDYDAGQVEQDAARARIVCSDLPQIQSAETLQQTPVFVVGMPRSGTTLIESIIAAHPNAFGAGELDVIPRFHDQLLKTSDQSEIDAEKLQQWREEYLEAIQKRSDRSVVVDKQPLNFRSVGLLRTLFPEATIIHITRNPVDTGFSIYRNDFGKAWPFATSLKNIAHFYGSYARSMAYWSQYEGAQLIEVQYENLVDDFENEARRIMGACGLEWNDNCLAFHQTQRPVATFSSMQVREPIREKVISAQEQYGELLDPLARALEQEGVNQINGRSD